MLMCSDCGKATDARGVGVCVECLRRRDVPAVGIDYAADVERFGKEWADGVRQYAGRIAGPTMFVVKRDIAAGCVTSEDVEMVAKSAGCPSGPGGYHIFYTYEDGATPMGGLSPKRQCAHCGVTWASLDMKPVKPTAIAIGQVWRRKRDGVDFQVETERPEAFAFGGWQLAMIGGYDRWVCPREKLAEEAALVMTLREAPPVPAAPQPTVDKPPKKFVRYFVNGHRATEVEYNACLAAGPAGASYARRTESDKVPSYEIMELLAEYRIDKERWRIDPKQFTDPACPRGDGWRPVVQVLGAAPDGLADRVHFMGWTLDVTGEQTNPDAAREAAAAAAYRKSRGWR